MIEISQELKILIEELKLINSKLQLDEKNQKIKEIDIILSKEENWNNIELQINLNKEKNVYLNIVNNYNNLEEIIYWGDSFDLIMVIFKIICFAHIFACIWHAAAFYPTKTSQNWLKVHFLEESVWQTKYLYSIYSSNLFSM